MLDTGVLVILTKDVFNNCSSWVSLIRSVFTADLRNGVCLSLTSSVGVITCLYLINSFTLKAFNPFVSLLNLDFIKLSWFNINIGVTFVLTPVSAFIIVAIPPIVNGDISPIFGIVVVVVVACFILGKVICWTYLSPVTFTLGGLTVTCLILFPKFSNDNKVLERCAFLPLKSLLNSPDSFESLLSLNFRWVYWFST